MLLTLTRAATRTTSQTMKTNRAKLLAAAVALALSGLTACTTFDSGSVPRRILDAVTTTTLEILGQIPTED